jgi:hypothetical protein
VVLLLVFGFLGAPVLRIESKEPATSDPISPRFRSAMGKAATGSPFLEGYRWTYTSGGKLSLLLETTRGTEGGGLHLTTLVAKQDTFFWTNKLELSLKDGKLADFGDGFDRSVEQAPPQLLVLPLEAGLRWKFEEPHRDDLIRCCPSGFEAVVVGKEPVTVPAGAFEAWKIEYVLLPRLGTEHDFRAWYTPGLGFVRIEKWRESTPQGKTILEQPIVHELASIEETANAHRIDYPSPAEPVEKLPRHVQAIPGQVTLYADFGEVWDGGIVLYLINRTQEPIYSQLPGWMPWTKLEARNAAGSWERAQAHFSGFCPVGESAAVLEPDRFIQLLGYLPRKGETRDVRYRIFGDMEILSNVGPGLADPVEIREAQFDKISIGNADAEILKRFFLDEAEKLEYRRFVLYDAFNRLQSLPTEQAMPLIEMLLSSDKWMRDSHRDIFDSLLHHDHERFLSYTRNLLRQGNAERRLWLFEDFDKVPFDREILSELMEEARNPKTPQLSQVLDCLARFQHEWTEPLFALIESSQNYAPRDRLLAGFHLASLFGTNVVSFHIDTSDELGGPSGRPGAVDIAITNITSEPVQFSYSDPSNVLRVYAWSDSEMLIPRPEVAWFTKPDAKARQTRVLLKDGESHVFHLNLLDYYDVPQSDSGENQKVTLAVSCSIPGRHSVPQPPSCPATIRIPRGAAAKPAQGDR